MLPHFNTVTACLRNKQMKTIFVTGEDCIAFGFTVRLTYGKPCVTIVRVGETDEDRYSPFGMTKSEWHALVIHVPTIHRYLERLEKSSSTYNNFVRDTLTSDHPTDDGSGNRDDTYLQLADELYAVRNFQPSM